MSWNSRLVVFMLVMLFSQTVHGNEGFKVEITSEVSSNLLLKIRLTNIDKKPIRYKLGALSKYYLYPRFRDQSGKPVILNKIRLKSTVRYPPFYSLLNPNEFLESKINLKKRFPTLEKELKKQALVLAWRYPIKLGGAVDSEKIKFILYVPKASRVSFQAGSEHLIDKRN